MSLLTRLFDLLSRLVSLIFAPLNCLWQWLRGWLTALKPCRFSILLVVAGLLFLILVPQGRDVLRALAEHQRGNADDWTRFFFFLSALLWSLSAWYWAQVMLKLAVPNVPGHDPELQNFRVWLPRVIGAVAAFGLGLAFYLAARGYTDEALRPVQASLEKYSLWSVIGGVVFLVATAVRRPLARRLHEHLRVQLAMQGKLAAPLLGVLDLKPASEVVYGTAQSINELPPLTRRVLMFMILLAIALFFVFVFAAQSAAPALGAAAILLLAASGWIAIGSALDGFGMRRHIPVFTLLLVLAVVFSLWNDNHRVHELQNKDYPEIWDNRADARKSLENWLNLQVRRLPRSDKEKIPLYLVNAEGGGIRAAYWTASVLGEIQKQNPCFADQLFSMSGVSGGSLGAGVFNALLADAPGTDNGFRCDRHGQPVADTTTLQATAQKILGHDFLSPVMAGMLYPDLAQRFWPWPIEALDRGRMLEAAFEHAWRLETKSNRLAEPVDKLWRDRRDVWMPALLLNATWVETGKRLIASNLRLQPLNGQGTEDFVDVEDTHRFFGKRALALSTAVHLSARFTYVSPAGTLVDEQHQVQGHAVDGGYFENSGATTTHEILKAIDQLASTDPTWKRVEVTVIHISNDPVNPAFPDSTLATGTDNQATQPRALLNETLSPLLAIINTRGARGEYARTALRWHAGNSNFLHFGLCKREEALPLGWVLSEASQKMMERQLTKERCIAAANANRVLIDNPGNLCTIRNQIVARFAGAGKPETCTTKH